jgi:hypothetical protein
MTDSSDQTQDLSEKALILRLVDKVKDLSRIIQGNGKEGLEHKVTVMSTEFVGIKEDVNTIKKGVYTIIIALIISGICGTVAFVIAGVPS